MPIDYRALVHGLGGVAGRAGSVPELDAVGQVVSSLRAACGAAGATFTEYGDSGGRVVVAQGAMAWALGQPVPAELALPEVLEHSYQAWVESMPGEAAQPLLARGIVALAGRPVPCAEGPIGLLHLYFTEFSERDRPEVEQALRVGAALAELVYSGREATPVRSPGEEDDRSLFLAVAGHELRTPVTVIKGYASLLADHWDSLDDEQRRMATRALTQRADELARLVDRLLGTSAGEPALVRTVPFDPLNALLRAADGMPGELRRGLRVQLPNWLPPACGDPDVIGTVVTELVTNAVRASGDDGPVIHYGQSRVDLIAGADTDTVFIQVLDRGVGIDPAQAERAFERFWRAGGREGRGGVGLGLYLVRRLVERQNGWVSLRPRDGGGTVAEVRLARADGPPGTGPASVTGAATGEVAGAW